MKTTIQKGNNTIVLEDVSANDVATILSALEGNPGSLEKVAQNSEQPQRKIIRRTRRSRGKAWSEAEIRDVLRLTRQYGDIWGGTKNIYREFTALHGNGRSFSGLEVMATMAREYLYDRKGLTRPTPEHEALFARLGFARGSVQAKSTSRIQNNKGSKFEEYAPQKQSDGTYARRVELSRIVTR